MVEKALLLVQTCDMRQNVTTKKARKPKATAKPRTKPDKQHPVHASAFIEISDLLKEHARNEQVDTNSPKTLLLLIADAFGDVGKKVQKIVR